MNKIMLRGFADKCAENRINPKVMLKYAVNLGAAGAAVGGAIKGVGKAMASFKGRLRSMYAPTLPFGKTITENLPVESAEGAIGQAATSMKNPNSWLSAALSGPATKPTLAGVVGGGLAGNAAAQWGKLLGMGEGANWQNYAQAPQVPSGPPMPSGQQMRDMNPGMLQQLMAAMKSNKGMAAGAGVAAAGAGAAGANYLKGKSKPKKDNKDSKKDGKKDKKEDSQSEE